MPAIEGPAGPPAPRRPSGGIVREPEHLAALTPEQRADLRLWHGRIPLLDRIKTMRHHARATLSLWFLAFVGVAVGVTEGLPPLVFAPIVPFWMSLKLWRRGQSLRESGLRLRRVLFMPWATWVLPRPPETTDQKLERLAPREVLEGPHGRSVRHAAAEQSAILDILAGLAEADRKLLPDLEPTVHALVERVASLAQMIHRFDREMDLPQADELDAEIADLESEPEAPAQERRLALLKRKRAAIEELAQRRATLGSQLDNAELALDNLRFDLIKLRSSGLQSALSDVSSATQEARALSRELGMVLEAAEEVRKL